MNRRTFLTRAGAAGLAATVSEAQGHFAQAAESQANQRQMHQKPHGRAPKQVILLMTDATRRDMLNCYKLSGLQTPNLDRLAADGIRYERAYTTQPVSTPARSAIFTGLYPHSNGCWGNSMALGDTTHTLGQRLTDKGVHCG